MSNEACPHFWSEGNRTWGCILPKGHEGPHAESMPQPTPSAEQRRPDVIREQALIATQLLQDKGLLAPEKFKDEHFYVVLDLICDTMRPAEAAIRAEEHPLLIFTKLPRPKSSSKDRLNIRMLLTDPRTRTLTFGELPDRLWAVTGYRILDLPRFENFGRLRNTITHLGVPSGVDFTEETYRFSYQIMNPMIQHFWDGNLAEYFGAYEDEGAEYVQEKLDHFGL